MYPTAKKAVTAMFKRLLKEHLPGYSYAKAGIPHRSAFECVKSDDLRLQIYLHWSSTSNQFAYEVGWTYKSTRNDIMALLDPINAIKKDAVIIGLSNIAGRDEENWFDMLPCCKNTVAELNEENEKLAELVRSSFQMLLQIGIPYLDRVVAAKLAAS